MVALEIAPHGDAFRVETLSAGDELGWSSVLVGKGKFFQARTLEPVEALMFDGNELRAMCERVRVYTSACSHYVRTCGHSVNRP